MIILCTAFGSLEEYLPVSGEAKLEPPSTCAVRPVVQLRGARWVLAESY